MSSSEMIELKDNSSSESSLRSVSDSESSIRDDVGYRIGSVDACSVDAADDDLELLPLEDLPPFSSR